MTTNRSNAVSGDRWVIETDGLLLKNVTGYFVRHDLFLLKQANVQCNQEFQMYCTGNVYVLMIDLENYGIVF